MTEAEYESQFEPTKYIPYLTLTGELWDVFCEDLWKNWPHYNGTALYMGWVVNVKCINYFKTRIPQICSKPGGTNGNIHSRFQGSTYPKFFTCYWQFTCYGPLGNGIYRDLGSCHHIATNSLIKVLTRSFYNLLQYGHNMFLAGRVREAFKEIGSLVCLLW